MRRTRNAKKGKVILAKECFRVEDCKMWSEGVRSKIMEMVETTVLQP